MGFAQEMDDFINAFDAGTRIRYNISQRVKLESDTARRPSDADVEAVPSSMGEGPGTVGETSAPQVTSGGSGKEMAQTIYDFYRNKGLSHVTAGGITNNLMQESGGDPDVISGKRKGDNGTAAFVAQWRDARLGGLVKYAKTFQPSLEQQLEYVLQEMDVNSPHADKQAAAGWDALKNAKTLEEATSLFQRNFERPADLGDIKGRMSYSSSYADKGNYTGGGPVVANKGAIPTDEEQPQDAAAGNLLDSGESNDGSTSESPEIAVVAAPGEETGEAPQVEGDFTNPYAQTGLYRRGGAIPEEGF